MKIKKKLLSAFLALTLLGQLAVSAAEIAKPVEIDTHPSGYIPFEEPVVDFEHTEDYIWGNTERFNDYESVTLPSSYDAVSENLVTEVKNQGMWGTCWAFSTLSALETSMIKNDYATADEIDYSERHLAYFTHTKNINTGDGKTSNDSTYGYYGGGNAVTASRHLAGWQGAELEENYPYNATGNMADLTEAERFSSKVHLQEYLVLEEDDVKSAILEYGSVICAYYDATEFHTVNNAYYQNQYTNADGNHAVTIVGWDDNYALSNFDGLTQKPTKPGAWKIKNSWGSNWGDGGYFWLSYEDTSLGDFVAVNAEPASNYHVIHQYDGSDSATFYSVDKSANIFTAADAQNIEAVGFFTRTVDDSPIQYTADVYLLNDNAENPEDGTKVATASGSTAYTGYHTEELSSPVAIESGKCFSVVLTLKYPSGANAYHAFEGTSYASSNDGESFAFLSNTWIDAGSEINNARIKAYATYESVTLSYNTNGGSSMESISVPKHSLLTIPESPIKNNSYFAGWFKDSALTEEWDFETDKITQNTTLYAKWSATAPQITSLTLSGYDHVLTGGTTELTASYSPYYAADTTLTWSVASDNTNGQGGSASVSNGVVRGISKGYVTVTATAAGGASDSFSVRVHAPLTSVSVYYKSPVYSLTENKYFMVDTDEAKTVSFYIFDPNGSGAYVSLDESYYGAWFHLPNYNYIEGKYSIVAVAYDWFGNSIQSTYASFWVSSTPVLIGQTALSSLYVGGFVGDDTTKIMLAYYKNGQLQKTEVYGKNDDIFGQVKEIPYDYSYSEVKVFWWDSLNGLTPITTPLTFTTYTETAQKADSCKANNNTSTDTEENA